MEFLLPVYFYTSFVASIYLFKSRGIIETSYIFVRPILVVVIKLELFQTTGAHEISFNSGIFLSDYAR